MLHNIWALCTGSCLCIEEKSVLGNILFSVHRQHTTDRYVEVCVLVSCDWVGLIEPNVKLEIQGGQNKCHTCWTRPGN